MEKKILRSVVKLSSSITAPENDGIGRQNIEYIYNYSE